ncbi:helix-turn-helix domain-containing protein [uncultured Arthrobacter sp.]|uniref:ArsR/SmtB family transcription factor n=1 Tax=uncultured Arthrobacter sp. TaxID=114050 RepID=UPI003216C714
MALADPVRRSIIARLSRGPATVNELAEPFEISKQAVSKHIQVLEQAVHLVRLLFLRGQRFLLALTGVGEDVVDAGA